MTARTHDLFAATFMIAAIGLVPLESLTVATALTAVSAGFLGGLTPDIDESGSEFWQRLPAGVGSLAGKIVAPVFISHRFISHSLVGVLIFGKVFELLLLWASSFLKVDIAIVWWAGILGFTSHLFADSLTKEGVPLLWPLPFKFGIPPIKGLRVRTGSFVEKFIVFPGLVIINGLFIYSHYSTFKEFFHNLH